jgi:hypothetical protein
MASVKIRRLVAAGLIIISPTADAVAQLSTGMPLESDRQLTAEEIQKRKEIDEAYKSTLNKLPDKKKAADPWGDMRSPALNSSKQR